MRSSALFLPAALVLAVSSAAVAAQTSVPSTARAADDNEVICKKEAKTGTRFATKVCHTKAQWEQIRQQSQRDLREQVDRPMINNTRG